MTPAKTTWGVQATQRPNPDFPKLADAFGIRGRTADSTEALAPALVAVPVDYDENRRLTERLGNPVCPIRVGARRGGRRTLPRATRTICRRQAGRRSD